MTTFTPHILSDLLPDQAAQYVAESWVNRGISVIPCWPGQKKPAIPAWEPYKTRLPSRDELRVWFRNPRNLAVITGWRGLAVLDFDNLDLYTMWRALFDLQTYEVITARGVHVYVYLNEPIKTQHWHGIDLICGGYVLAPPSVHPSGAVYMVLDDSPIARVNSAADLLPDSYLDTRPAAPRVYPDLVPAEPVRNPWQAVNNSGGEKLTTKIKRQLPILSFFPDAVPTSSGFYLARCPLHDDNSPSMWIQPGRGMCGCYAGCNNSKAMDVINLVGRMNNITDREAIRLLAAML